MLVYDCQLVSEARPRRLRSSDSLMCAVQHTRDTYGDGCFTAAGSFWLGIRLNCDNAIQTTSEGSFISVTGPRHYVSFVR